MAHLLSNVAGFRLDNASGTLTDISGSINSVEVSGGNASVQNTGMGQSRHKEINDIDPIQSITVNGWIDSTTNAIISPLVEGTSVLKTVEVTLLSGDYFTGEARVGDVSRSLPIGLQSFSLELRSSDTTGFIHTSVAAS